MADAGNLIIPDWPAPPRVRACSTVRTGGVSRGAYASLNLGDHVGDHPDSVAHNRQCLARAASLPAGPRWLNQVHGNTLVDGASVSSPVPADAATTDQSGIVCAVLTADCLPVLLCDRGGKRVAAVHCGWRGLAANLLERVLAAWREAGTEPDDMLAWLGPAIGADAYEVGDEVRGSFRAASDQAAFAKNPNGRWQLDLYRLARGRLQTSGLTQIFGGQHCTHSEPERFYSYRRDGACGRQASLIWLVP